MIIYTYAFKGLIFPCLDFLLFSLFNAYFLLLGNEWDRREGEGGQEEEQGYQGQEEKGGGGERDSWQKEDEGLNGFFSTTSFFYSPNLFLYKAFDVTM